jgi:hypothetical protein
MGGTPRWVQDLVVLRLARRRCGGMLGLVDQDGPGRGEALRGQQELLAVRLLG